MFYSFKGDSSLCRSKIGRLSWLWTQEAMLKQGEIKILWASSPVLQFLVLQYLNFIEDHWEDVEFVRYLNWVTFKFLKARATILK